MVLTIVGKIIHTVAVDWINTSNFTMKGKFRMVDELHFIVQMKFIYNIQNYTSFFRNTN